MVQVHQFGVANSNAISGVGGSDFATMPVEVKKILGIKKALND